MWTQSLTSAGISARLQPGGTAMPVLLHSWSSLLLQPPLSSSLCTVLPQTLAQPYRLSCKVTDKVTPHHSLPEKNKISFNFVYANISLKIRKVANTATAGCSTQDQSNHTSQCKWHHCYRPTMVLNQAELPLFRERVIWPTEPPEKKFISGSSKCHLT